jgi:SNF2 family DNA or RNA helicase
VTGQAVDRAFRVGQKRDVTVYRVVTCGTVEEKILRNQIFKRGLHHIVVSSENQQRYFTRQQLRSLFEVSFTSSPCDHVIMSFRGLEVS